MFVCFCVHRVEGKSHWFADCVDFLAFEGRESHELLFGLFVMLVCVMFVGPGVDLFVSVLLFFGVLRVLLLMF